MKARDTLGRVMCLSLLLTTTPLWSATEDQGELPLNELRTFTDVFPPPCKTSAGSAPNSRDV